MGWHRTTRDPDGLLRCCDTSRRARRWVRCAAVRVVREDFRFEDDLRRLLLLKVGRFAAYIFLARAYAGVPLTFIVTGCPRVWQAFCTLALHSLRGRDCFLESADLRLLTIFPVFDLVKLCRRKFPAVRSARDVWSGAA